MTLKTLILEILIINSIISAIFVIISKNPVISVIYLISLILNSALYLIVKGIAFIGISYILVYLGAIIVLFLFVIMMINVRLSDILETGLQYTKNIPLALAVSGLLIYELFNLGPSLTSIDSSLILNYFKHEFPGITLETLERVNNNPFTDFFKPLGQLVPEITNLFTTSIKETILTLNKYLPSFLDLNITPTPSLDLSVLQVDGVHASVGMENQVTNSNMPQVVLTVTN
jgi:NADH:ubiquinone oxidoreductase subunit 6 (subunit J)